MNRWRYHLSDQVGLGPIDVVLPTVWVICVYLVTKYLRPSNDKETP